MPLYDFENHTRSKKNVTVKPKPIILLDGILIFENKEVRDLCDLKIFVDTDPDVRLARRLLRDVAERGRTYEFGIEQYLTFTRPMHLQFVEPFKRYADIIVPEGGLNNMAMNVLSTHVQSRIAEILS
jgi:uridine kinase